MSRKLKDMLIRVARTFAQAAIPVFLVTAVGPIQRLWADLINKASGTGNLDTGNVDALRAALVTVIAAGVVACVSLLWNVLNDYLKIGNNWGPVGKPSDTEIGDKVLDPNNPAVLVEPGNP